MRRILQDRTLTDLGTLAGELPVDLDELRVLQGRCVIESAKAARAGRQFEAGRFAALASQFQRLINQEG